MGKAGWDLQRGFQLGMPLSKSMHAVAPGVEELRVKDASGAYRAFYLARLEAGILAFHAFTKKTQKTPKSEPRLAQRRLKEMLDE